MNRALTQVRLGQARMNRMEWWVNVKVALYGMYSDSPTIWTAWGLAPRVTRTKPVRVRCLLP